MTFLKKHILPLLLLVALVLNIGFSALASSGDSNAIPVDESYELAIETLSELLSETDPEDVLQFEVAPSEPEEDIETEPVSEPESTAEVDATEETTTELTEAETTEIPEIEAVEVTPKEEIVEEITEAESDVPVEEAKEETEEEATEAEVEYEDIPKKDVIEQPWQIDRPDVINATRAFATGLNGKSVSAVHLTYLSKDGQRKIAYCIEPGVPITNAGVDKGYTSGEEIAAWTNLSWEKKNAIALITAYGYPTVSFSDIPATTTEKFAATQLMIWEIVLGARSPYDFSCSDMYCSAFSSTEWDGLYAVYNSIHNALRRHNSTPTFATRSPSNIDKYTYELGYNKNANKYTLDLTDNTPDPALRTLPDYTFKSDISGLTVTRVSDTTLHIECTAEAFKTLPETVTFSAVGKAVTTDCDSTITVWEAVGTTDQKLVSANASRDPVPVYFRIKAPTITQVQVTKTDTNGNLIPGAHLQIIDSTGKVVAEWTTTTEPYIVKELPYNATYTLHEVSAPFGYIKADDVTFTVEKTSELQYINMIDPPTVVVVNKVDENGNMFEGAVLQLIDETGKVIDEWTSNGNSRTFTAECAVGKTYTLHEVSTRPGYILADDVAYTVKNTAEVQNITMKNLPTKIQINKVDAQGNPFSGAVLQILDKSGNVVAEWTSSETPYICTGKLEVGAKYILHEVETLDGYVLAADVAFTVKDSTDVQTVNMVNDYTKIQIDKVDTEGKAFVGATLQILDADGDVVDEWTTTGKAYRCDKLEIGKTYTLHETATLPGYVLADDVAFTVKNTTEIQKVAMVNDYTKVQIDKVDENGKPFSGATLQILDKNNEVVSQWTTNGQPHRCDKLEIGETYTLHEVATRPGYVLADDKEFTVLETTEVQKIELANLPTGVRVTKKTEDGKILSGAVLQIIDKDNNIVDEWTTSENPYVVTMLTVGETYTLHEKVAPKGYATAKDVEFVVAETTAVQLVEMIDKPIVVSISKTDVAGNELPGASMKLTDKDGEVIEEWISTNEPHIVEGLEVGKTYILHEDLAPLGYATASSVEFIVTDTEEVQRVVMIDEITVVEISKKTVAGDELPGASMKLTDKEGKVIEEWISTDEPHIVKGLEAGKTYILHEDLAPLGYLVASSIEFTVKDTSETQKIEMIDEITKFEFIKVGEKNEPLSGGVFQILDKEGSVLYEWTSSDKPFAVEGLTVGETYYMHEVTAPKGYELAADVEFTVKDTAEVQTITMVDYPITGDTKNMDQWLLVAGIALAVFCVCAGIFAMTKSKKSKK